MVLGIIIFNLETSKLLFNNFYYEDGNDKNKNTRIMYMIRLIMNEYIFKKQSNKDSKENY
jgi:hypothetical protein